MFSQRFPWFSESTSLPVQAGAAIVWRSFFVLALGLFAGCGDGQLPQAAENRPENVPGRQNPLQPGQPLQERHAGKQPGDIAAPENPRPDGANGDADAEPAVAESRNPLLRGLRQFLGGDNLIEEKGELDKSLTEADKLLTQIKQQNRNAMRNVNRQMRVGGTVAPLVVLITVPELSPGDLGCYGQQHIATPNIDRLASGGVRFATCYAGSPNPELSWWCLMTGQNLGSYRSRFGSSAFSPTPQFLPQDTTLPQMLWQAGYHSSFLGAWGLSVPLETEQLQSAGLDDFFGFASAAEGRLPFPEFVWNQNERVRVTANANGQPGQFSASLLLNEIERALMRPVDNRPLFLQIGLPVPDSRATIEDAPLALDESFPAADRRHAAAVQLVDECVGRIVAAFTESGRTANAIIVLTSSAPRQIDSENETSRLGSHGAFRTRAGALSEGRLRVPLIIARAEPAQRGIVVEDPCGVWDILPTLADLTASIRRPRSLHGLSLVPLWREGQRQGQPLLFWEHNDGSQTQAVRMGQWKGIRQPGTIDLSDVELYDLKHDPGETTNVAASHPEIIRRMLAPDSAPPQPAK